MYPASLAVSAISLRDLPRKRYRVSLGLMFIPASASS